MKMLLSCPYFDACHPLRVPWLSVTVAEKLRWQAMRTQDENFIEKMRKVSACNECQPLLQPVYNHANECHLLSPTEFPAATILARTDLQFPSCHRRGTRASPQCLDTLSGPIDVFRPSACKGHRHLVFTASTMKEEGRDREEKSDGASVGGATRRRRRRRRSWRTGQESQEKSEFTLKPCIACRVTPRTESTPPNSHLHSSRLASS